MKGINMQDSRYGQRSNLDLLETESEVTKPKRVTSGSKSTIGRLFVLELSSGQVFSLNADGSDRKVIVSGCRHPDGIVVEVESGHIYWTNMGIPNANDGSIERADIDGQNRTMIVHQEVHSLQNSSISIIRMANCIGRIGKGCESCAQISMVRRLKDSGQTGQGEKDRLDQMNWCVGITVDPGRGQIYWTQKVLTMPERVESLRGNRNTKRPESTKSH